MKKETIKNNVSYVGMLFIILGITSFSNHPNWGKAVTLFGTILVIISLIKKVKMIRRN